MFQDFPSQCSQATDLMIIQGFFLLNCGSTTRIDTQGCGAGLADTVLSTFNDITLFDTKT